MQDPDFQPKMVGRENELKELQAYLDKAAGGEGRTIFISGEAGIGKTRLVNELKQVAQSKGFQILSGNSMYESLTPFMPIMEALRSGGLEYLFAEEAPRVEAVYLVTNTGLLIREVVREETELNPDIFVSMFTTVTDFLNESLSKLSGEEEKGTLNSLGYQNYRILIERREDNNLVVILTERENEFLLNDMKEILLKITRTFKKTLKEWGGDEKKVAGIEELLKPLITSGKYDGIYYGKDDPKIRRNLLFENVSLGLTRMAQQTPTLLCIDDLQWADPSSLALIHYIARNTRKHGLFILGTYRPEDVTALEGKSHPLVGTMQLMDREDLYEKMELERLPEGSIVEFLSYLLGEIDFTDEFKGRIYKETEGNPLFVIQLIKYMVDEKIILEDEGTWKLAKDFKDIEIPSKINNVIERRLNRLEKEDRKVLDYASVIGETFTSSILTHALDVNRTQLLEHLRGLEQKHRLIRSHDGSFKFDHAKIKEVLYTEIPRELRRDYHSIIANSIETLNKDNLDNVIGDLAFHYYQCKNKEKALHYLIKAAEKAKKDYSNEEAIRFYREALEFEENEKVRMEIFEILGDIYDLIGDYVESINSYESALEFTEDKKKIAEIKAKIGEIYKIKGEYDKSISISNEALGLVRGEGCKEEAFVLHRAGSTQVELGNFDKALEISKNSLEIGQKIDYQEGIARCFNIFGVVHSRRGFTDLALKYYQKSLAIQKEIGNQFNIAQILNSIGRTYMEKGDYERSLHYHRLSLEIQEKIGDQLGIGGTFNNIGLTYLKKGGEYDKALEHFKMSLEISEKLRELKFTSYSLNNIGDLYRDKGEYRKALDYLEKSLEIKERIGDQYGIQYSFTSIGRVHFFLGDYNRALNYFEKSLEIDRKNNILGEMTTNYFYIAEVYVNNGDLNKALEFCNKAFDLSNKIGLKENIAILKRILGKIYREQEKWEESIENFRESLKILKENRMKMELGESHFEFGLMWKAKGDVDKAREHFQKALGMFEEMKIEKKAENVKVELEAL